jgi:LacI family transcriptional regulator
MTVSRVTRGDANVRPETRRKVQKAIEDLGYTPNQAARDLASGKPCKIALLYANPSSLYLSEFLMGSLAQASARNAQLIVEHCAEGESADDIVRKLLDHRVDAVLVPPPLSDDRALLERLDERGIFVAQIATGRPVPGAYAVMIDDESAARDLTNHLIGLNHRTIGFITGDRNQQASSLRRKGYESALRDAGIAIDPQLIAEGDFSYGSGREAAKVLLGRMPRPTAIIASNDDMAAAVVAVAHRSNLDVPGELSVCGFDDTAIATTIWPELTTIRQPIAEMSGTATEMLVTHVRNAATDGLQPRHVNLDYRLILRDSAAPPTRE